ncbi:MAG: hypothetical protein IJX95_09530 [Lachnospiraceae bacterium]|nr:hypothetical protein [Lachnospiraceae bacterium]
MRRIKWLVAGFIMVLLMVCGNTKVAEASTEYRYCEITDGEGMESRKGWLKNGEEIAGNPVDMEQDSYVTIEVTPDESCAEYLETFNQPEVRVTVNPGVTVTFGSESERASIQWLTCNNADVTVWAEDGEFNQEGFLAGSVYGVSVYNSTVDFHGNIQYLCLGDEFTYGEGEDCVNGGTVTVDGKVYSLEWYKTTTFENGTQGTVHYKGFTGNASVSEKVKRFTVREIFYSNTLETALKATTVEAYDILDSFEMTNGELSEAVNEKIEWRIPDVENFYFELTPSGTEENRAWYSVARYPSGAETGVSGNITQEEAEEILESGAARVVLDSSDIVIDLSAYDLAELKVYRGTVTVKSLTPSQSSGGKGLLQITSYGEDTIDITVLEDVNQFSVGYTRHNPNMNITVNGEIASGEVHKFSLQSDQPFGMGSFTNVSNMAVVKDGIWDPALFLSLGEAEYQPVNDSFLDSLLGLQKKVQEGVNKISEMADMFVTEMDNAFMNGLDSDEKFQEAMSGFGEFEALVGVGIEISKFKYNEDTGEVSERQEVTELDEENPLPFTIKIPGGYKPNKKYVIVREHGTGENRQMEVLEPERDGDKLTFRTNKFSSFTIVETPSDEFQEEERIGAVKSASLELTDSIAIIYEGAVVKDKLSEGDVVTAKITYMGEETVLSGTQLDDVGKNQVMYAVYEFKFTDILPQFADENVKFELLLNGEVIACKEAYSVKEYCTSMLNKEDYGYSEEKSTSFRAMLVNMLYYADAVKNYRDMTETLTAELTEEQKAYRTTGAYANATEQLSRTGDANDPYCFKSANLVLKDKVNIQIDFTAEDTSDLELVICFGGDEYVYDESDFGVEAGRYYVLFDKICPTQYETQLTAYFQKNGVKQTQELTYSVGTYVARSLGAVEEKMQNVLKTMYEFGDSAKKYVEAQ